MGEREDRPFHVEAELALGQQPAEGLWQSQYFPQTLEDQRRTDPHFPRRRDPPLPVGAEDRRVLGKPRARGQQGVELAGPLQDVEPPQGGDDPLPDAPVQPLVLDDLQILVLAGPLDADEHGASLLPPRS
jgi:hypothetical protein